MKSLELLPKCNTKMQKILVKHVIEDFMDEKIENFIKNLLQNNCYSLVIDDKDVVFNYYEHKHSVRKTILDKIIHQELITDESIDLLLSYKSIDIYMKYDEEDSWKVRILISKELQYDISYFTT